MINVWFGLVYDAEEMNLDEMVYDVKQSSEMIEQKDDLEKIDTLMKRQRFFQSAWD